MALQLEAVFSEQLAVTAVVVVLVSAQQAELLVVLAFVVFSPACVVDTMAKAANVKKTINRFICS